jgi:hypothetical protein
MSSIQNIPDISTFTSQFIITIVEAIKPYLLGIVICSSMMTLLLLYICIIVTKILFKKHTITRPIIF